MPTDRRPRRSRHAARLALALLAVALVACGGTTPPPLATSTTLAMDEAHSAIVPRMGDHPPGAPPVGIQAAVPPVGPLATPATRATASAFFYRLEVRRTWTEASAGGGTAYRIDVAVCNQTSTPRAIRLAALTVVVRPRGRPGAVGYGLKPDAAPGDGFADAPLVPPGGCVGGVVTITPPQSEVPDTLWYRSGDGREAADPVALPFPD